jgi:TonB family protein
MRQRALSAVVTLAIAIVLASPLIALVPTAKAADPATGPVVPPFTDDYYPRKAKRQGITGRVGLECSVDEKGRVRHIVVLESGGPLLDDAAKKLFADMRFNVPPNWSATGGPAQRLRYGVIFRLAGKPDVAPFEDNRQTVVITDIPGT